MTELELKWLFQRPSAADADKPERKAVAAELVRLDHSKTRRDDPQLLTFIARRFESQDEATRLAAIKCIAGAPVDDFRVLPVLWTAAADENLQIRQIPQEALVRWELTRSPVTGELGIGHGSTR